MSADHIPSNPKHERRVVGHASGWQEQLSTCACGKPWPCPEVDQTATIERLAAERDEWKKAFQQEVARLQTDIQELTCGDPRLVSSSSETLSVGTPVTYTPRYASQLPRDGWTIDQLPPEPTYVIRHPSGSVIAVAAGELRAAQKAFVQLCAPHGQDWLTCPECAKAAVKGNPQV